MVLMVSLRGMMAGTTKIDPCSTFVLKATWRTTIAGTEQPRNDVANWRGMGCGSLWKKTVGNRALEDIADM